MNEIQELENYLERTQDPADCLLTEARLLVNSELREHLYWQKQTYALVQHYGRKHIKAEIEVVHKKLFSEKNYSSFQQKILSIFKTKL